MFGNNKNQKIKCDVTTCKHLDDDKCLCNLNEIKVSCCDKDASKKDSTMCSSYDCNCLKSDK